MGQLKGTLSVEKRYSLFHSFNQKIAASTLGAALCARMLHALDDFWFRRSGGRASVTSMMTGLPLVMLTCKGAKSGLERTSPLLAIRDQVDPRQFALVATNWGRSHYPSWYYNLRATPRARCVFEGRSGDYLAHEAAAEEYDRFWDYAADTYVGYPSYKGRISGRRIPIMIMTPVD